MTKEEMLRAVEGRKTVMHVPSGVLGTAVKFYDGETSPFSDAEKVCLTGDDAVQIDKHVFLFRDGSAFDELNDIQVKFVHVCRSVIDQAVCAMVNIARRDVEPADSVHASASTISLVQYVLEQAVNQVKGLKSGPIHDPE